MFTLREEGTSCPLFFFVFDIIISRYFPIMITTTPQCSNVSFILQRAELLSHRRVINLEIPFSTSHIFLARKAIAAFACSIKFTSAQVEDITLAVGEACTNAVKHGCVSQRAPTVRVKCVLRPEEICISVMNSKHSDKPLQIPCQPDTRKGNGYGLFIMSKLMDRVRIHQTDDYAAVIMTKRVRARS